MKEMKNDYRTRWYIGNLHVSVPKRWRYFLNKNITSEPISERELVVRFGLDDNTIVIFPMSEVDHIEFPNIKGIMEDETT